ncbi:cytochrome c biogenesis CcdA family protein [Nakamurella sp. A5-74]|uniref:Cytochrome c biogenesis CcdA family protein n=1 Tax=Nakamurella sp. A5-74 TaxID=3158264 RepID=A0AAU8DU28_9ACTN
MSGLTDTVASGPFLVAGGLAVAAGFVSFASPCVLPLVPGYLSYLTGLVGAENSEQSRGGRATATATAVRSRVVQATLLFIAGFTVVFVLQSMIVIGFSRLLSDNQDWLTRIGGVVMVVMGLALMGWVRPLQREARIHAKPRGRIFGALALGAIFSLGWTACLGPVLAGVTSLAISSDWNGNAWRGLYLVVLYCAGLGIPFLLLAFGFGWASGAVGFLRRHARVIQVVGATAMIVLGLLMVVGLWGDFIGWLQQRYVNDSRSVL